MNEDSSPKAPHIPGDTVLDERQVMLRSVFPPTPPKTRQMCQLKKIQQTTRKLQRQRAQDEGAGTKIYPSAERMLAWEVRILVTGLCFPLPLQFCGSPT